MTPQEAFDAAVNHRLDLDAYSNQQVLKITTLVGQVSQEVLVKIAAARVAVEQGTATPDKLARLEALVEELGAIYDQGYARVTDEIKDQIEGLAEIERDFALNTANSLARAAGLEALTVGPTVAQIVAAAYGTDLNGQFLSPLIRDLGDAAYNRTAQALRIGFVSGESLAELVDRVVDASGFSSRAAKRLIRTTNTHLAAVAAGETYKLHGGVDRIEYVAVLDSRTTSICRGLDGNVYPVDFGPRPPQHIQCRSVIIPLLTGEDPPQRPRYEDWLRSQSPARIKEILGPSRAALFQSGGLSLTDLNGPGGRLLRLDELSERSGAAFLRAGLSLPERVPLSPQQAIEITARQENLVERVFGTDGLERSRVQDRPGENFAQLVKAIPVAGDRTIVKTYTTNLPRVGGRIAGWKEVNQLLRDVPENPGESDRLLLEYADALNDALARTRTVPGVSWRGIAARPGVLAQYHTWQPGEIRTFPEFLSTSVKRNVARGFASDSSGDRRSVLIRIEGKTGRDLRYFAEDFSEAEVLFRPSTRFRVISTKIDPDGATVISLEELE